MTATQWQVVLSLVGACLATVGTVFAAARGWPGLRRTMGLMALIAAAYALSYPWLLGHPDRSADWSRIMRWFGAVQWFAIAWSSTAAALHHAGARRGAEAVRDATESGGKS